MHVFETALSLKANYLESDDIEFAAWKFADHEHREAYRDSGQSEARSTWLHALRMGELKEALAAGDLLALGVSKDDPNLEICRIPGSLFFSGNLRIDSPNSALSGMGREYSSVRICRAGAGTQFQSTMPKKTGRPNHLAIIIKAWTALEAEIPKFRELDITAQNIEIQEMAAKLFPAKFPGNGRIGNSTIRRHRRANPDLFD